MPRRGPARGTQGAPGSDAAGGKPRPLASAEVSLADLCPSWPTIGMAHYNFKKITVVPSAKVSVPRPSALAFLGRVAGRARACRTLPPGPAAKAMSFRDWGLPGLGMPPERRGPFTEVLVRPQRIGSPQRGGVPPQKLGQSQGKLYAAGNF